MPFSPNAPEALAEREGFLLTAGAIKAARSVRTAVFVRIDCRLERVLDLTDAEIQRRLRITLSEILGPWRPWNVRKESGAAVTLAPTQLLGRRVHESRRFEAILTPSARDSAGRCLALFPDRLGPGFSSAARSASPETLASLRSLGENRAFRSTHELLRRPP